MTALEFLAYVVFGDYTFAEKLAPIFSERVAANLVEYMHGERFGFIYMLRRVDVYALYDLYAAATSDPDCPPELAELAATFRRQREEYAAVCRGLDMEVLSSMREAGLWD